MPSYYFYISSNSCGSNCELKSGIPALSSHCTTSSCVSGCTKSCAVGCGGSTCDNAACRTSCDGGGHCANDCHNQCSEVLCTTQCYSTCASWMTYMSGNCGPSSCSATRFYTK